MEWTLDHERLDDNPLMTGPGREEIRALGRRHGITVGSLTGDCFMQAPFYKVSGNLREHLFTDLLRVLESCADLGITWVVVPLVDNGGLENQEQEEVLLLGCQKIKGILTDGKMQMVFESDYPPDRLAMLMENLDVDLFGVNFDIGNSAALGYDFQAEIAAYGARILNVHIKDRLLGGTTVPLGQGAADIPGVLRALSGIGYANNYILQTARAADGDHAGALCGYRELVKLWLKEAAAGGSGT
jgi:hexulose-6-phosphate isomerase